MLFKDTQTREWNIMLKSIQETKKLFTIEGMRNGQVDIKTSKYLLSLPEDKQIEVLSNQLENLKEDFDNYTNPVSPESSKKNKDVDKTQLQILIQIIESMLSQI